MRLPKMYQEITLQDGRKCTVIDYMGDIIIADTRDEHGEWVSLSIYMEDGEFFECGEDGKVYNICPRKGIHLKVSKDRDYCFLLGEKFEGEYFIFNKKQFGWLCQLLDVDAANIEKNWHEYFEYNNLPQFLNAHKFITTDPCVYYAYGYNSEKKSADALYRFKEGKFERFFPREGIWMELPEQRMILKESKPRYEIVSEETAMCLSLLV